VRKAHKILVGRLEYKKALTRDGRGGKHNIKVCPKGIIYKHVTWVFVVQENIPSLFLGKR
jgi:hypothetical protein